MRKAVSRYREEFANGVVQDICAKAKCCPSEINIIRTELSESNSLFVIYSINGKDIDSICIPVDSYEVSKYFEDKQNKVKKNILPVLALVIMIAVVIVCSQMYINFIPIYFKLIAFLVEVVVCCKLGTYLSDVQW